MEIFQSLRYGFAAGRLNTLPVSHPSPIRPSLGISRSRSARTRPEKKFPSLIYFGAAVWYICKAGPPGPAPVIFTNRPVCLPLNLIQYGKL